MAETDASETAAPPAPVVDLATMHASARVLAIVLSVVCALSFLAGYVIVAGQRGVMQVVGIALVGMSGSGLGALTSLLARYAAGFELDDGTRIPTNAEGELYGKRIAFCMLMRPVLGLLVAPLTVAAIALFFKDHEELKGKADAITVAAFIGGLYAKSAVDAAKNAFKVVFRA